MVPASHPRYLSLMLRERIAAGVEQGIASSHGLIAHGRGEAFDYLLGERTHPFAAAACTVAAALLLRALRPVISVNGNVCALCAEELVTLSRAVSAPLEVNIFHTSPEREQRIAARLRESGATAVLMPGRTHALEHIDHNRRWVNEAGIHQADVVFVPLEDGDRCAALVRNGKRVITVDLNPLSRTARTASVTIVDNLIRAMPLIIAACGTLKKQPAVELDALIAGWDNAGALRAAEATLRQG